MNSDLEARLRRSLRRWRITAGAALALLLATVAWSLYAGIDQGITLAYLEGDFANLQRTEELLERVVLRVSGSTTKADLLHLLHEFGVESFEKEGGVHAEGLSFYFTPNGALACVTSEYPPERTRCAPFASPGV